MLLILLPFLVMLRSVRDRGSLLTTALLLLGMLVAVGTVTVPVLSSKIGSRKSEEDILKLREEIMRRKEAGSFGSKRGTS